MMAKGTAREFAEKVFEQIRGFGDYGFPESHAASFALIAYATAWLRCHYPEVFVCSLLNAQPMGFYTPATIVHDAIRYGVEVRPVDVTVSAWDCTLEPIETPTASRSGHAPGWPERERGQLVSARVRSGSGPAIRERTQRECGGPVRGRTAPAPDGMPIRPALAVRMGLRYVKSLSEARDWRRIEAARTERPFASMEDFTRRTRLDERVVRRLAEAGAFARFEGARRDALWEALDLGRMPAASRPLTPARATARLRAARRVRDHRLGPSVHRAQHQRPPACTVARRTDVTEAAGRPHRRGHAQRAGCATPAS